MLTTFLSALEQMSRILLLLSIGFLFNKLHLLPKTTEGILSRFVTMLFLPCLNLYTNMMECHLTSLVSYGSLVLAGAALCLGSMALSYPLARLFGGRNPYMQGLFRYALTFPNTGAVATPLVLAFFGTAGLFKFNLFWFTGMIMTYTWGIAQMQPDLHKGSVWKNLLKCINPATMAMAAGMVLGLIGAKNWIPSIFTGTVKELGNCYVTIGLLLTGFSIADYPLRQILGSLRTYLYAAVRLIVLPVLVVGILILCKASSELCIMAALAFSGPCGMNAVIYPAAYGEDCKTGASMVLVSSVCSVATIPLIYALVQQLVS